MVSSAHKDIGTRGQFRGKHLRSQISAALGFTISNMSQLLDLGGGPIKNIKNIHRFAFLDSLGDHGEWKKNNCASRDLHARVSAILILNCSPLNAAMLNQRIAENDAH